ncbi:unnamed protein product [Spirodela intermedia]|uniref:Uncharacterized protein n=2 Tax=Spirodela intermedia TaxID=51605 RepID=A0A7I8JVR1_SPIIN|nr:unnamed protein product [Spirodela intermedia]CAA6673733.1 unnamed protein product [Spirodela intermedia]CAA7410971.1 unnamed protein product [Spirodela intermedia]
MTTNNASSKGPEGTNPSSWNYFGQHD